MKDHMSIDNNDRHIALERYKVFTEKKKVQFDLLKFILWIATSLIAVNCLSIGTKKFAGLIETSEALQVTMSMASIFILIVVILKIIILYVVSVSSMWKCSNFKDNNNDTTKCDKWICELRWMTSVEIFTLNKMHSTIVFSVYSFLVVIILSTFPVSYYHIIKNHF